MITNEYKSKINLEYYLSLTKNDQLFDYQEDKKNYFIDSLLEAQMKIFPEYKEVENTYEVNINHKIRTTNSEENIYYSKNDLNHFVSFFWDMYFPGMGFKIDAKYTTMNAFPKKINSKLLINNLLNKIINSDLFTEVAKKHKKIIEIIQK